MPELLATQRDVAAALRDSARSAQALRWIAGDAALAQRRLAIYRGNVHAAITKALAAAYPVIRQVVGEEFFDALASDHGRDCPSASGDLHEFGAGLAEFLERFEPARALPYLADLARLEWAVHRAYGASDAAPPALAALAEVAPQRQSAIRFVWAAGTAVVASAYPIVRIWRIHQSDHDGEFSVDWSVAEQALVARDGLRVAVSALDAGSAAFVGRALEGAALGAATDAAVAVDTGFDLGGLLARAIASRLICGFTIDEDRSP